LGRGRRRRAHLVTGLLKSRGVRLAVKGKSMIGEEIGLRQALGAAGIEAWKPTLANTSSSSPATPVPHHFSALHLSRAQVSELFVRTLGRTGEDIRP
jgi:L-lactate dehydrogenase complex protein LldF